MTRYVGIDQSYSGFAVLIYDNDSGAFEKHLGKFEAKKYGQGIDRLQAIGDWLYDLLTPDIGHVCMEGYAPGAKFGREMAGELGAITKQALWQALQGDARYPTIVAPTGVKKYATGKGVAPKDHMLLAVYKRWGVTFDDDNLADAYTLARIAAALDNPGDETTFQQEVLNKLVRNTGLKPSA